MLPIDDDDLSPVTLGKRVQRRRSELGMSISDLAARADISRGMLSEVERGIANPSYKTLVSLARALGAPIGSFFEEGDREDLYGVVRAGEHRKMRMADDIVHELLTPSSKGALAVYLSFVPPGWTNDEYPDAQASGEKCVYIIEGTYHVHVGGTDYVLSAGDTITFDASITHWARNETDTAVRLITSVTFAKS